MSIHENELRKGVNAMAAGLPITITEIRSEGVFAYFRNGGEDSYFKFKEIDPIPITPELIESIGMKKRFPGSDTFNIWDWDNNPAWDKCFSLALLKIGWKYLGAPQATHLNHLHQLQNLYFSLTGKELEYSPNIK